MTSDELADEFESFIRNGRDRILGSGNDQYSMGDIQKFETMSVDELLVWADEEVQDVAAYAAMLSIRLARVREKLKDVVNQA